MSRGPGRWQRMILDALERRECATLTHPGRSHSEQNALRRAAHKLDADGKIHLVSSVVDGRPRLVVYRLDAAAPAAMERTGMDGKRYRLPSGVPVERREPTP